MTRYRLNNAHNGSLKVIVVSTVDTTDDTRQLLSPYPVLVCPVLSVLALEARLGLFLANADPLDSLRDSSAELRPIAMHISK